MTLIPWSHEWYLGIDTFDADHQRLIRLILSLESALENGNSWRIHGRALRELKHYTEDHFRREEAALRLTGYPGLDEHVAQHREFEARLEDLQAEYDLARVSATRTLSEMLQTWLVDHIQVSDRAYLPHLRANGFG